MAGVLEINQLRYFVAVVKTGRVTKAAEAMFVTPPSVSTAISRLEDELGVPLFIRRGRRLELTAQGKLFAVYAEQILDTLTRAYKKLNESTVEKPNKIMVAICSSNVWVDFISSFVKDCPTVDLSTTTLTTMDLRNGLFTDQHCCLLSSENDVSLLSDEKLEITPLYVDRPAIMVHPLHPLAQRSSVRLEDLESEKLIWSRMYYLSNVHLLRYLQEHHINLQNAGTYSTMICEALVAQNSAVAFTTMHLKHSGDGGLHYIPIELPPEFSWRVVMCERKNRLLSPEEQLFKNYLLQYFHVSQ